MLLAKSFRVLDVSVSLESQEENEESRRRSRRRREPQRLRHSIWNLPDSAQHWWRRSSSSSSSTGWRQNWRRLFDKELGVFDSFELSLQYCATVDCSTSMMVDLLGCSGHWQEAMCYFKLL